MTDEATLFALSTGDEADPAQVGGKAAALIRMTRAGLPVPPGFVLTTAFFRPWLDRLRSTPEWTAFVETVRAPAPTHEEIRASTANLRAVCADLPFTETQHRDLSDALDDLTRSGTELVAVRSSAPQEDLSGASFAGVYDSVLSVPTDRIEDAVRSVFLSALDLRVVSYKLQRGFDPTDAEIAVLVQRQLDSASAGVAFSVNPRTNDYDEVVVHANRGLGESVVSGSVTPDEYVVDKVGERCLDITPGAKETALWARPDGHAPTSESDGHRCVLTERQAVDVARMVQRVEAHTTTPVDIEWAHDADGELSLLQARPVTTYFPLPEELRTAPGEPRRLYADSTLLEEGLQQPLSVFGGRWLEDALVGMARELSGRRIPTRKPNGFVLTVGGRWYANLSHLLWLGTGRIAQSLESLDVHAARVLRNIDPQRYRRAATSPGGIRIARAIAGTLVRSAAPASRTLVAVLAPQRARRRYEEAVRQHDQHLAEAARTTSSVSDLADKTVAPVVRLLIRESLPLTCAAEAATALIRLLHRRAAPHRRDQVTTALSSMPGNITVEMGLDLYRLARALDDSAGRDVFADLPELARRVEARDLPEAFLRQWDAFLDRHGFRGPTEIDLAAARYADDPLIVLDQLRQYALLDEATHENPQQAHERRQRERREAYSALLAATRNPLEAFLLRRLYRTVEAFSGYREIHKYHLVRAGHPVRLRALRTGRALAEQGRLDSAEQVFDLTDDDLRACDDSGVDLRTRAHHNTRYRRRVREIPGSRFPVVVDSRGHTPRPAATATGPGVLVGAGVSTGTVRGPAKVLDHVGQKPVLPGEIVVARATDPGWTPLFVNAAGVVLETGGSFQHGALVAREYGKPCLVGIEHATRRLRDGDLVDLDGTAGTLTLVPEPTGG